MKKLMFIALVAVSTAFAQVPTTFPFQTTLLDTMGAPISGPVDIHFTIYQDDDGNGTPDTQMYGEAHTDTTSVTGYVAVSVGSGIPTSGSFASVNWNKSNWLEVSVDINDGNGFTVIGTTQLLAVPYARSVDNTTLPSFFARVSVSSTPGTVIYDNEIYETGGDNYNNVTGEFTTPITGIYLINAAGGEEVRVNGIALPSDLYTPSNPTFAYKLTAGDIVTVNSLGGCGAGKQFSITLLR